MNSRNPQAKPVIDFGLFWSIFDFMKRNLEMKDLGKLFSLNVQTITTSD